MGHFRLLVSFVIVWVLFAGSVGATPPASAAMSSAPAPTPVRTPPAHLPANLCTLLPAAQIGRVLGQPFSGPIRKPAPPLYRNTAKGTECGYRSKQPSPAAGVPGELIFTVHVESSSSAARDVFKKLRAFQDKKGGGTTSVTGIGDAAYRMTQGYVLFVLKGKAHYSIRFVLARLQPFTTQDDQQQQNLATWVARQL